MYPFGELRAEYQLLWDGVVARCSDLPLDLSWPDDVDATWTDDRVVVKQTCGWPLVTQLETSVRVVGAFEPAVTGAVGHRYRSVIVAATAEGADDLDVATVAFNSIDSLSGWVSLLAWSGCSAAALRTAAVETGSHSASLAAVREGAADVAAIDAVTYAHVRRLHPELLTGLVEVDRGPLVPSLPVVVPANTRDDVIAELREALTTVVSDAAFAATCQVLLIDGFVPLDLADYQRDLAGLTAD